MLLSPKVFGILVILILVSVFLFTQNFSTSQNILRIGSNNLKIEIVIDPSDKAKGLSGRESLSDDNGMLFVYEEPSIYSFWMKDMNFAIDIIWIDKNKKVIDITHDVRPESYPKTFSSQSPAQYILEVNSGWAEKHAVEIEDSAEFTL